MIRLPDLLGYENGCSWAQIVKGLDEGLKDMKVGGLRRLYIPGNLSFPKGVASAPGR